MKVAPKSQVIKAQAMNHSSLNKSDCLEMGVDVGDG